jgi:16S rRNA U516 pseudouridylate synthase RsuA-like enzyme
MAPRTVRLDRALSKLGVASRAEAQRLIAAGRVRVNDRLVHDLQPGRWREVSRREIERVVRKESEQHSEVI